MSSNTQRVWKVIKPHLPLIKFKKGGNVRTNVGMISSDVVNTSSTASSGPPIGSTPRGSGIEEEFMPQRYQRKPITDLEMEIIERGGAL